MRDRPLNNLGGIRRGTDVLKALALRANAVLIGRPYLFGLSVAGAAGVRSVTQIPPNRTSDGHSADRPDDNSGVGKSVLWA